MLGWSRVRRFAVGFGLVGIAAIGTAGCVLVPAPVPFAAPIVIAPRAVAPHAYHHGYWWRG